MVGAGLSALRVDDLGHLFASLENCKKFWRGLCQELARMAQSGRRTLPKIIQLVGTKRFQDMRARRNSRKGVFAEFIL